MINDLDDSIKKMLQGEIPIKNGEIDIKFDQPTLEWQSKLNKPTVNFFLYDVRENVNLRQHQWDQIMKSANGGLHTAQLKRTPFRLDCHYVMTTWVPSKSPDDEHRLLTLCLLALFRHPILPETYLQGLMQQQPYEVPCRVASHDKLTNPAELWSAIDSDLRPGVSYLVTIALDPWNIRTEELVRTFTLRLGLTPDGRSAALVATAAEKAFIGGRVTTGGRPEAGITVMVKETGQRAVTDENGRFRLGSLPTGQYTLITTPEKGKSREMAVTIPQKSIDIEI